jgi:hypothetical protein
MLLIVREESRRIGARNLKDTDCLTLLGHKFVYSLALVIRRKMSNMFDNSFAMRPAPQTRRVLCFSRQADRVLSDFSVRSRRAVASRTSFVNGSTRCGLEFEFLHSNSTSSGMSRIAIKQRPLAGKQGAATPRNRWSPRQPLSSLRRPRLRSCL